MNKYLELKQKQQEEINNFPMFFAFSNKQFEEGMKKFGLKKTDTNLLCSVLGGGFIKKIDVKKLSDMMLRHTKEIEDAIKDDIEGDRFIYEMFRYELDNHEYNYTGDPEPAFSALGLTAKEILKKPNILRGFKLAGGRIYSLRK